MSPVYMVAIGDSKTIGYTCCISQDGYQQELAAGITADNPGTDARWLATYAVGGITTSGIRSGIDAFLAPLNDQNKVPEWVLINLGSNDAHNAANGSLTQAEWTADFGYILDAVHAKWSSAAVRVMRVIFVGKETGTTLIDDSWIPDVLSTRSAWAAVGPDERTFLPGHLSDGTHPDASGYSLTAAAWQAAMGY